MQHIGGGYVPEGEITLFERSDDWSAAAFWYQDPGEELPAPASYARRVADLEMLPFEEPYKRVNNY